MGEKKLNSNAAKNERRGRVLKLSASANKRKAEKDKKNVPC
jgi:hypothetical protein